MLGIPITRMYVPVVCKELLWGSSDLLESEAQRGPPVRSPRTGTQTPGSLYFSWYKIAIEFQKGIINFSLVFFFLPTKRLKKICVCS